MARLWDHVLATSSNAREIATQPLIVADNVSDYWWSREVEKWSWSDTPNLAPPFGRFFVECRRPDRSLIVNVWEPHWPERWGGFFAYVSRQQAAAEAHHLHPNSPIGHWFGKDGWEWVCCVYMTFSHGADPNGLHSHHPLFSLPVSPEGRVMVEDGEPIYGSFPTADGPNIKPKELLSDLMTFSTPLLLAISFMHCKNVERREVEQPPKLSKKWQKKHGRPLVRYHVLDIDPMRKVLNDEGKAGETGLKKALHICRGHFATYTEDAPLFGRVTGTFWKPQHVRGSAKHGAVVKDYNVKALR